MPIKQRRITVKTRRKNKIQESPFQFIYLQTLYERNLDKSDSDIRTIPDHTFGKVYSNQIVSQLQITEKIPSSMIEPEMIVSSMQKSRKKKTNNRKRS
jgi:hypothetical protein